MFDFVLFPEGLVTTKCGVGPVVSQMSLGTGEESRKMQSVLISLLPSVLVLLFSTLQSGKNEVLALPIAIPRPPPGSKVVIVMGGGNDGSSNSFVPPGPPTMVTGESQIHEVKSMILHPSANLEQIKRQGHLSKQAISSSQTEQNKKEKHFFQNLISSSPRHISNLPSDIFHQRKDFHVGGDKMMSNEKRKGGPGARMMDFRPHQPDITSIVQNAGQAASLGTPSPTPMANKINPYTNGVASSFPPGIDPYEGFIRYAAENLDSPMGNMVDYHSLEHYYGPQHPLSPYHSSKETGSLRNNPYADSFSYNNNGIESSNSPPPPPPQHDGPPPHGGPPPPDFGPGGDGDGPHDEPMDGGFRTRGNPMGGRPGGSRGGNHNPVSPSYEHGIDHFHAPSPGLGSAPPRPRPPASDPSLYEEEVGYRSPPFEPPPHGSPRYTQNHHALPFKHSNSAGINSLQDEESGPPPPPQHGHSPGPDPADLGVYEEGPPPPGSHPPIPPPPHLQEQNSPHHHHQSPPQNEAENNDGGDDAIWGILDLAEMLEKGQLPGHGNSNTASATPGGGGKSQANPQKGGDRRVVPIFRGGPPPSYSSSSSPDDDGPPTDHDQNPPPHIPQLPSPSALHSNSQRNGYPGGGAGQGHSSDGGFDYDNDNDDNPEGMGGNGRPLSPYGTPLDSQESNDYGDDAYSK